MRPAPRKQDQEFQACAALITGFSLATFLVALTALLYAFQHHSAVPLSALDLQPPPSTSPLREAEFEAGWVKEQMNGAARKQLEEYAWVDRKQGIVRIPIERAMEILAGAGRAKSALGEGNAP